MSEELSPPPANPDVTQAEGAASEDAVIGETEEPRPSRRGAWLAMSAVALALGLIWAAPGVVPHDDPPPGAGAGAASENPGEAGDNDLVGKVARLDYTLKDMHGVDVTLSNFKGKVILLNFWATWCGPCKAEIPALVMLQDQYRNDLVVLGVSIDDPVEKLTPYAAEYQMNYPVLVGNGHEEFQDAYGPMWGIPVSVFVDRDGRIAKKHSGIATKEQFEREIKALL
jgi:thiol-disulfide isomerase/thioredoxin